MKERFQVRVELELHTISCPGVWLCPSGYVQVTIKSLGHLFKTAEMEPKFPLLVHELFVMEGYFKSITSLYELEMALATERVEIGLWQTGRRLAHYVGSLGRLLQSVASHTDCVHVVRMRNCVEQQIVTQLLMTPSRSFPGILAPKIEISGRASIRTSSRFRTCCRRGHSEVLLTCLPTDDNRVPHEERHNKMNVFRRQHPVCHTKKIQKSKNFMNNCHHFDKHQFEHQDRDTVRIFANKMRYQDSSESTSGNSSNSNTAPSYNNQSRMTTIQYHSDDDCILSDDHSKTCSICQSYKTIFTA